VDSLQPELKWKGKDESKKYDLAIWNAIHDGCEFRRHKMIYEKTALSGTSHKVEIVLEPNRPYFWSVRKTGSESWSMVTFHAIGTAGSGSDCDMFKFYTPTAEKLEKKPKQ
jgi:hypothetical protein